MRAEPKQARLARRRREPSLFRGALDEVLPRHADAHRYPQQLERAFCDAAIALYQQDGGTPPLFSCHWMLARCMSTSMQCSEILRQDVTVMQSEISSKTIGKQLKNNVPPPQVGKYNPYHCSYSVNVRSLPIIIGFIEESCPALRATRRRSAAPGEADAYITGRRWTKTRPCLRKHKRVCANTLFQNRGPPLSGSE